MPNDWDKQINLDTPLEKAAETWTKLDVLETDNENSSNLLARSLVEKQKFHDRLVRTWHAWQEISTAYNDYEGSVGRDIRLKNRSDYYAKFPMGDREQFNDNELLDAVLCIRTTTPGCNPNKTTPWLIIKPPIPKFNCTDLSKEIGSRWVSEILEWLKRQNMLLDTKEAFSF